MGTDSKDLQNQFKEIVRKLPEDKKKVLYERLKAMDAEERNKTIASIVAKEHAISGGAHKETKKKTPEGAKKTASNKAPSKKVQTNKTPAKKQAVQKQKPQAKKSEAKKPEAKKKETKKTDKPRIILWTAVIVLGLALLGFTGYRKRASIKELWQTVTGTETEETSATETTETAETTEASPTPTPSPTPSPTPTPVPLAADAPDLTGMTIVLDPGHQQTTSEEVERVASWMSAEKPRCTRGGEGVSTGIMEYELTLRFCTMLKEYLEGCGATVIMTRTVNDIDLSNQERAQMATSSNCDLFLRIHADSANDSLTSGIQMYVPSSGNYYRGDMTRAQNLGEDLCEATGLAFNGVRSTEVYTGLNYATSVHSLQVSIGYLSNSDDEAVITDEENQYDMVVVFARFCAGYK